MTNEEIESCIQTLRLLENTFLDDHGIFLNDKHPDNIEKIITFLHEPPCEDCISREQTLKAFAEKCGGECACCEYNGSGYDNAENCKLIKSMPSVTPSRPRGKWIVEREEITTEDCFISYPHTKCSLCKVEVRFATNFCPCCGADMRKSEDKE